VARGALERAGLMARKTSFYYSFLVLPREERRAIIAVWDFCRAVDDAVDEAPIGAGEPSGNREALTFWREELSRCYDGMDPATPQGRRLQPYVRRFNLPRPAFDDVIDGVAMDIRTTRYLTFDDLFQYCRRVASAVGMICIRIFGCRHQGSEQYALHLGVALQLTNILRDVKGDLQRGRLYLPLEDLARFDCTEDDLAAGVVTDRIRRLMTFECDRARTFYQRAMAALPVEDRGRLVAAEIMRAVYFETLRRIERADYDVFHARLRLSRPRQAMIALRQWLGPVSNESQS
jgi:phytoene synthase